MTLERRTLVRLFVPPLLYTSSLAWLASVVDKNIPVRALASSLLDEAALTNWAALFLGAMLAFVVVTLSISRASFYAVLLIMGRQAEPAIAARTELPHDASNHFGLARIAIHCCVAIILAHITGFIFQYAIGYRFSEWYGFAPIDGDQWWSRCLLAWWLPDALILSLLSAIIIVAKNHWEPGRLPESASEREPGHGDPSETSTLAPVFTETLKPFYVPAFWLLTFALVLIAYGPTTRHSFWMDDYFYLAHAAENGFSLSSFWVPHNQHMTPLVRVLMAILYRLFGNEPAGYYWVGILFHLLNVWLASVLLTRLLESKFLGMLAAFIFAISFSHWDTTMWITTVNVLGATAWYSGLLIFYVKYLDTRRSRYLVLSVAAHACMLLTFTYGFETPLLLFALYFIIDKRSRFKQKFLRASLLLIPYVAVAAVFAVLRNIVVSGYQMAEMFPDVFGGVWGPIRNPLEIIKFFAGGVYEGFLKPYTGVSPFSSMSRTFSPQEGPGSETMFAAIVVVILVVALLMVDWRQKYVREHWPMLTFCALWFSVLYALPIPARLWSGYDHFIDASRYRYPPSLPAAAIVSVILFHLKPYRGKGFWRIAAAPISLGLLMVISLNIYDVRRHGRTRLEDTERFDKIRDNFIEGVREVEGDGIIIVDNHFTGSFAGMFVRPSHIMNMYFTPEEREAVRFISEQEARERQSKRGVYTVDQTGALEPFSR